MICMEYCIRHKATLCVDWRDVQWGQGDTDFADYFEIIKSPMDFGTIKVLFIIDKNRIN